MITVFWNTAKIKTYRFMLQKMLRNGKRDDQQELYTTRHVVHL